MHYPGFVEGLASWLGSTTMGAAVQSFFCGPYPVIITAFMVLLLVCYLPRYVYEGYSGRYFMSTHRSEPHEDIRYLKFGKRPLRAVCWVLLMFVASRVLWLGALQIYLSANGWATLNSENLYSYINKWDAVNYTRIAQYWYGFDNHGIDDYIQEYTIAFLPGYPVMIKALNLLVNDYVLSGLILSNVMALGSGILLYAMVSDMYSEPAARRCCFFFYFSVAAGVFSATHSESAMVFLTLLAVYLARRRHFIAAVAVGAYASFTRQFGMFVAVPLFYEMLCSLERYPTGTDMVSRARNEIAAAGSAPTLIERLQTSVRLRKVWRCFLLTCCVLVGYGAYLLVNYMVYGTPTAFLYYQQLNWGNRLAPIWTCIRTSAEHLFGYLISGGDMNSVMGIFLPQLVIALAVPCIMLCFVRRGDAGDNAYAWCYIALTFSSTWLISGIRYVAAMYPLYIMLALLSGRRGWPRYLLYSATLILFTYYNVMYSAHGMIV